MVVPINNIANENKPKQNVTVNYSTNLTTDKIQNPLVNPNFTNVQNGKALNPTQQITVIGKGTDPEVITNHPTKINPYAKEQPTETQTLVKPQTTTQTTNLTPQDVLGPIMNRYLNYDPNSFANTVLQITNGLTLPELFQILGQNPKFWAPSYSSSSFPNGSSTYVANVQISGNKITFSNQTQINESWSNGGSYNSQVVNTLTIEPYNVTKNGKTYHLILVKEKQYNYTETISPHSNPDVYQDTLTWYYIIDPTTKKIIYQGQEPPQQSQYWLPEPQSGYIAQPSQVINNILQQYGYALPSNVLQEINNLQPGQSITVFARVYNSQLQEWGAAGAEFIITYLGNNQYQIKSVDRFYDFYNFNNPWTSINETITVPTYSINQQGQISTTNLSISGQITTYGTTNINLPYYTATYNVNETIPINYGYNTQTGQLTFWSGNLQGGVTLQSIDLPTITKQQLQALENGQNIGLKPGWYYNPDTGEIINVSYQTAQQPQTNLEATWFGYSSVTPQTIQNLPQNTYLFLNPMGYSSTNPNVVYSIGVNFNTNTVYLINSYGQIIGTKTFNNIQSMFNYLQNNWNLNLNPTPQPGQPVLSTTVNYNNLNPNLQLQSIILQNDQLVNNAVSSLTSNPSTFLQDIATITTAGFSTALADMGLKSQALSVQNFAQQLSYDSILGNIVGGAEVGGLILLGFFAPETLLNFGMGAIAGVGISEALSLATGQGPLSSSQIVAQTELGGLFSVAGSITGGYLSAAFSKGAGALTTMITGSEEWGSKIAGLTPLWRFAGSEVTNLVLSYPFFGNNPKEWLEWSTLFSLGDVFIPSIAGSILSRLDVWRGKAVMAEKGPIELPLEDEPIEGYTAKLPDNTVLNIVPRATAGEGTVSEFIQRYVYEVGENNLLSHVTPSMTFINDLSKGKEIEIVRTQNKNAWDWRVAAGDTGFYLSPGESSNEAVALGFYGGIADTHPSLEYPGFQRIGWREALYRFLYPFDRAGIILTNEDTAVGPLPPQELLDYIDYLKKKYNGNLDKVVEELLKHPKYGPMYMRWKNAVKEFSATTGTPVVGSEDITGLSHERQFVVEPGAKLKGTGVTYNVWIRQTPELLESLPGPFKDLLSDWFRVRITRANVISGKPTDLFAINNINTQSTAGSNLIRKTKTEETYYEREAKYYRTLNYIEYAKVPLYYVYDMENLENNRKTRYIENTREAKSYEYNPNEYRENYNNREYRVTLEEYPYKENYYEYKINERPYRIPYEIPIRYYNYYYGYPYPPEKPPYTPYNLEEEQPNKNKSPPKYPSFRFPEITIMGQPIRGLVPEFGRGVRSMYDIQYALSRLTL